MYDLKQAMRALCPEAAEVVKRCLKSEDEKIALAAAQIAFERGYGRPELHAEVEINHRFVVAPDVMPLSEWLLRRGQTQAQRPRDASGARAQTATRALELKAEKPEASPSA
jgi:hypothetical protein